ncbi:MAG: hypothetical protein GY810_32390 [Aureispira sp.]|nr:hypothetical protein [Aureispira sp.]
MLGESLVGDIFAERDFYAKELKTALKKREALDTDIDLIALQLKSLEDMIARREVSNAKRD